MCSKIRDSFEGRKERIVTEEGSLKSAVDMYTYPFGYLHLLLQMVRTESMLILSLAMPICCGFSILHRLWARMRGGCVLARAVCHIKHVCLQASVTFILPGNCLCKRLAPSARPTWRCHRRMDDGCDRDGREGFEGGGSCNSIWALLALQSAFQPSLSHRALFRTNLVLSSDIIVNRSAFALLRLRPPLSIIEPRLLWPSHARAGRVGRLSACHHVDTIAYTDRFKKVLRLPENAILYNGASY